MTERTTSFAKQLSHSQANASLPERFKKVEHLRGRFQAARDQAHKKLRSQDQGSDMIKQEQPSPVLRPSSSLARETDRSIFSARLEKDDETARKRAFIQTRQAQSATQRHSLTQSYNPKKGNSYDRSI